MRENFLTSWGTFSFSRRTLLHGVSLFIHVIVLLHVTFYVFFSLAPSFRSILYISLQRLSTAERQVHPIVRPLQRILPHFCVGHTERRAVQLYVFTNIWLWSLNIAKFFLIKYKLVYTVFAAATNVTSSHTITFAQLENWTKRDFCFSLSWSPVVKRILLYCVLV